MASSSLTIEEIYQFFKEKGNVVKNREIVHHFKSYLTDAASKDDARVKFKKYVNILAHSKTESGEKFLILKTKYHNSLDLSKTTDYNNDTSLSTTSQQDSRLSLGIPTSPIVDFNSPSKVLSGNNRQPPPYRPPPPVVSPINNINNNNNNSFDNISLSSLNSTMSFQQQEPTTPQPPPRRRSGIERQKSLRETSTPNSKHDFIERDNSNVDDSCIDNGNVEDEDKLSVSVKERTQKFNRLASVEDELSPRQKLSEKTKIEKGVKEDDGASVTSLEPKKCMEWCVTASKGDLQELVKLAKDEPRLVNRKDPFTTVLHWGAKHGNAEIIKVFAGRYKVDVNEKTGYTPLHLAAQFGHKDIFKLLIEVYKADAKIRDYSGRLPEYYLIAREQKTLKDNVRKIKERKKQSDKDLGFLRIGSLNVRVKKTTEAFSNFLGVGGGSVNPFDTMSEKMHKGWGSADNVNQDSGTKGSFSKRKTKRLQDGLVISTPSTPRQITRHLPKTTTNDSDSDSAAGFDSQWKN